MVTDMNTDAAYSLIQQVLSQTPTYVWGILAVISALGLRQLTPQRTSRLRLLLVPAAFGALSLQSITHAFGWNLEVLALWTAGMALVACAAPWWPAAPHVEIDSQGRIVVGGSVWPLLVMWAIFITRYITSIVLVMHPAWRHGTSFSLAMPLLSGVLSGFFASRAITLLRQAPSAHRALRLA